MARHASLLAAPAAARGGLLAWGAVLASTCGLLGSLRVGGDPVAAILLYGWALLGPGLAWTWALRRQPTSLVLALVPVTGLAVFTAGGTLMAVPPAHWHPRIATGVVLALTFLGGLLGVARWFRDARPLPSLPRFPRGADLVPWGLLALGVGTWGVAVVRQGPDGPVGDYGMLVAAPLLGVAMAFFAAGFLVAAFRGRTAAMAGGVLGAILVIRGTGVALTKVPSFFYTYSHIGITELIAQTGSTHPDVDIYASWPGFFAGMAWLDVHHTTGVQTVAHWFVVVTHLLLFVEVVALARAFRASMRAAMIAAFVAEVVNWVGQDYFAPQAIGLVMAIAVLVLLLQKQSRVLPWLALPLFGALVITHQLTPVWVAMCAVGLVLLRKTRSWLLVGAMCAVLLLDIWINIKVIAPYGLFSGFSLSNAESNIPTEGVPARKMAQLFARLPAVMLWGGVALALARRALRRQQVFMRLGLAFASFAILGGQNYGGEAIFRVFLYSIAPGAVVVGELFDDWLRRGRFAWLTRTLVVVAIPLAALIGLQAALGQWTLTRMTPEGVARQHSLYERLDPPARLLMMAPGAPTRPVAEYGAFAWYDKRYDDPLAAFPEFRKRDFTTEAELEQLEDVIGWAKIPVYLTFSPEMRNYARYYGLYPPERYDRFHELVANSPEWERIDGFAPGLEVFRWRSEAAG